ncbi:protein phosphatase 2C domain-containing protein [Ilumatobacter sp.]|uniref:PP2C family serine/threonine-protein phosphatase n=1 Tax=Ilumatobacter sp. TaxID=1967498 RepID=UPI003C520D0D
MAELTWGAGTHPGQIRPDNEDHLYAADGIYVVADGMGGHEAGEVASELAVDRIREFLSDDELAPTAERVVEAISSANGDIFRAAISNPGQNGMGTTVTVIAVIQDPMAGRGEPNIDDNDPLNPDRVTPIVPLEQPEALVLANVGDSRTYLLRHDRLRRVTIDHSYVQELVSTGHITDDEARTHPRRNIITRALGIDPDVKVDWWTLPLVRGDRFLLCSDGLVDEIDDAAISKTLLEVDDPQQAADSLIEQANTAGGRDNVTVIVVDVLAGDDPPDPTQELDLIPTWADDPGADIDAPETSGDGESTTDDSGDAAEATPKKRSRRSRVLRAILIFVVLALLVAGFATMARWARSGYFVDFDKSGDVVIYQGQPDGFLWFEPTAETDGNPARDELDEASVTLVLARPTFSSLRDATLFIRELDLVDTPTEADDPGGASDSGSATERSTSNTSGRTVPDTTEPDTTEAS